MINSTLKKYAVLLSNDNYFYAGLKLKLAEDNITLFHESELDIFFHLCTNEMHKQLIIFYDDEFKKIAEIVFHDESYLLISKDEIRCNEVNFHTLSNECDLVQHTAYKSKALEKSIIYHYAFYKMTYNQISRRLNIPGKKVSYHVNNFIKGMSFKNKNIFLLDL